MKFPGRTIQDSNRIQGKFFEETFEKFARIQGFLPKRNMLSAQPKGNNRWQPVKSQLDWNLYKRGGQCAIVDCKSFEMDYFTFSEIDDKQLQKAAEFNRWGIPSGFAVYFRTVNKVAFYSGSLIERRGPRTRFLPKDGVKLGKLENFIVSPIFDPTIPPPEFY